MHELEPLRARRWDRTDHLLKLEEHLMSEHERRNRPLMITRSRAVLVALVLVLAGGFAGAGTASIITYYWKGDRIEIESLDGGRDNVRIYNDEGEKVLDEVLEPGEGLFRIESEDGERAHVRVAGPEDETESGPKQEDR